MKDDYISKKEYIDKIDRIHVLNNISMLVGGVSFVLFVLTSLYYGISKANLFFMVPFTIWIIITLRVDYKLTKMNYPKNKTFKNE